MHDEFGDVTEDDDHPLVVELVRQAGEEMAPFCTGTLFYFVGFGLKRYACTAAITAGCVTRLRGQRPSVLRALAAPALYLAAAAVAETAVRYVAARLLQWRASAAQRRALLTDVATGFQLPASDMPEPETRLACDGLYVSKASFGVTPVWYRRLRGRGWLWTTDLRHWQSVEEHRSSAGYSAGVLPVESNRWLLRRLHLRDVHDCIKTSSRAARAPPPLSLPDDDDAPAELLCPISHAVMSDPVVGPAGVSYERSALATWLRTRKTDPSTQGELQMHEVYSNLTLRSVIAAWADRQADAGKSEATSPEDAGPAGQQHPKKPSVRILRRRQAREQRAARARRTREALPVDSEEVAGAESSADDAGIEPHRRRASPSSACRIARRWPTVD